MRVREAVDADERVREAVDADKRVGEAWTGHQVDVENTAQWAWTGVHMDVEKTTQWAWTGGQADMEIITQWDLGRGICWAWHIFYMTWVIIQHVMATGWPQLAGPWSYIWTGESFGKEKGVLLDFC